MAKPVFLVGWRRSGTTWLGNLISQHSNITSVVGGTPGELGGCVESFYFSHLAGRFGDLSDFNNLICFIEVFGSSAYYVLSGLDKGFLYKERPDSYEKLFRCTMERCAEINGTDYWFEKNPSHSFHVEEISGYYPDARFIAIKRNIADQVKSAIKMNHIQGDESPSSIGKFVVLLRETLGRCMADKHIDRFKAKHPDKILVVEYTDLVEARQCVLQNICDFIGVGFEEAMLQSPYKPGTSFQSKAERLEELSPVQVSIIKMFGGILAVFPYVFFRWLYKKTKKKQGLHFPLWFFSTKLEEYGWDDINDPERMNNLRDTAK